VTIDGGNGNIEFKTGAPLFATASNFGNTGTTTFSAAAGTGVNLTFAGPVVLDAALSRTAGTYTFGGGVTIKGGVALVLTDTPTVTIGAGKSVKVGTDTVLTAVGDDVVLTPVTTATLTATAATGGGLAKLALNTAGLTVTRGTLAVSGELEATDEAITVTAVNAALVVNVGGKITTTADSSSKIVLGAATAGGVTLTGAGSWTASGADVLIKATGTTNAVTIGASGYTPATLIAGGTAPTINILAGSSGNNVLTIGGNTTIALGNNNNGILGKIVMTKEDTNKSQLAFGGAGAQITTDMDPTGATALTASGGGVFADTADVNVMAVSAFATATDTNFVTITGALNKLVSIVYGSNGGSDPFIIGPVSTGAGAVDGVISATTNCVTSP
jgi:hypothetical protein